MRKRLAVLILALGPAAALRAQTGAASSPAEVPLTGTDRQRVLETARARYYNLTGLGVKSFTCAMHFDLSTLSRGFLPADDLADRALLQSASFTLKVTPGGPSLKFEFPAGAQSQDAEIVASAVLWITELVQGFFQTWPAKAFSGPVPQADKQILGLTRAGDQYALTVKGPGGPATLHLDQNLLVIRSLTQSANAASSVEEHPTFAPGPDGLLFTGNDTLDKEPQGVSHARYTIDSARMDGFELPQKVHLQIGDHVDVRFALAGCKVTVKK